MAIFTEDGQVYDGGLIFVVLILCLLGRAVSIIPLCWILNYFSDEGAQISWKYQAGMSP